MQSAYEFTIRLRDEVSATMRSVGAGLESMHGKLMNSKASWKDLGRQMIVFNQAAQAVQAANQALDGLTRPGVEFQSSMADLKAITGLADDQIQKLGQSARKMGREFGMGGAEGVESYKLLLSQLGPELASYPEVLNEMARNTKILSKTMGGDGVAAASVLTTAMNQFQVSLDDPIAAAAQMTRMMNAMSASAKYGSAEMPALQAALNVSGMAAKTANVEFEETLTYLQALDKAGRKGAEGGTALRAVLGRMSRDEFLPPITTQALEKAGVDMSILSDESLTLTERLKPLRTISGNTALMQQLFGEAHYASAIAMIHASEGADEFTQKISGTNTAVEQAEVIMGTHAERMKRMKAWFEDVGVSAFNLTRRILPVTAALGQSAMMVTQLLPMYSLLRVSFIKAYQGAMRLVAGLRAVRVAKLAANAAFLMSPMGLVIGGVMAAAGAYLVLRRRLNETTAAQRALNDVKGNAEQSIVKERVEVERLTRVMHDENATREQKKAAYDRLLEIAPEYFGKLSFEEAKTNKLIDVSEDYIKSLQKQAMVKAFDEQIQGELERLAKDEIQGHSSKYRNLLSWLGGAEGISTGQQIQNELTALWKGAIGFKNPREILKELNKDTQAVNLAKDSEQAQELVQILEANKQAFLHEGASSVWPPGNSGATSEDEDSSNDQEKSEYEKYLESLGIKTEAGDAESEISRGVSSITSGGSRPTNISINMGNLIESFSVHTQNMSEGVEEIRDKVVEALMQSINSVNATARPV